MKRMMCGVVMGLVLASANVFAALEVRVTPQGDGITGKDRWGYSSWESSGFISNANSNSAYYWYETPDGSWRDVYMQVGLTTLPDADSITNATLYINLLGVSGNGCYVRHAADSSGADGNASQKIACNELVGNITPGTVEIGWLGIDVTDFIKNDVANGYNYAAFTFIHNSTSNVTFSSAECAELAPYLSVVPEPATLALLGLGGLTLLRKKK